MNETDRDYVQGVVRRSGTSFYSAMRILPRPKRDAMFAIYAFCREVDDISDDPGAMADKMARLGDWRRQIEHLDGGDTGDTGNPVLRALAASAREFGLQQKDFLAVIEGMEMDTAPTLRIADMEELLRYCDRVACAVGRLSNKVFGVAQPNADRVAATLGEALQITNILRDIEEDAERDRLYLPADMLRRSGIDDGEIGEIGGIGAVLSHPSFPRACDELADYAERRFREAALEIAQCDRGKMRTARLMMAVYSRLLKRLRRRGWQAISAPVRLSRGEKIWLLMRFGLF